MADLNDEAIAAIEKELHKNQNLGDGGIVGDVVHLVSGGPAMTVTWKSNDDAPTRYRCNWFSSDQKLNQEYFQGKVLVISEMTSVK